jgi:hypothetical protein
MKNGIKKTPQFRLIQDKAVELVNEHWKLSPVVIWILSALIPLLLFGALALLLGDFRSHGDVVGFKDNWNFFQQIFVGIPPVITFYFLFPKYISKCIDSLTKNEVFLDHQGKKFQSFKHRFQRSVSNRLWVWIGFTLSAAFLLFAIPEHLKGKDWVVKHLISLVPIELLWFIMFGMTIILAIRVLVSIWWINQAFKQLGINVRPLFPDGAGGLQPLSQFSLQLGYIIFFFGIELAANQYLTSYLHTGEFGRMAWGSDTIIGWIVYATLAPIAFFAPISAAHDAMQDAKTQELLLVSQTFEREYQALRSHFQISSPEEQKSYGSQKITELQGLYNIIKAFPIWPFQMQKFIQFLATVLIPLVLAVAANIMTDLMRALLGT